MATLRITHALLPKVYIFDSIYTIYILPYTLDTFFRKTRWGSDFTVGVFHGGSHEGLLPNASGRISGTSRLVPAAGGGEVNWAKGDRSIRWHDAVVRLIGKPWLNATGRDAARLREPVLPLSAAWSRLALLGLLGLAWLLWPCLTYLAYLASLGRFGLSSRRSAKVRRPLAAILNETRLALWTLAPSRPQELIATGPRGGRPRAGHGLAPPRS